MVLFTLAALEWKNLTVTNGCKKSLAMTLGNCFRGKKRLLEEPDKKTSTFPQFVFGSQSIDTKKFEAVLLSKKRKSLGSLMVASKKLKTQPNTPAIVIEDDGQTVAEEPEDIKSAISSHSTTTPVRLKPDFLF